MSVPAAVLLLFSATASIAGAQARAPSDGGVTASLGQPRPWKWTAGIASGSLFQTGIDHEVAQARLGVYRDIGNPVVGLLAWHGETYLGARDRQIDFGLRLRIVSPFARAGLGFDYNVMDEEVRPIFSAYHHGRRGGLFRDGSAFRLDYLPTASHSVSIGVEIPMLRRTPTGKTRPVRDHARLSAPRLAPASLPDSTLGLSRALATMREAATWIRRLNTPFLAHAGSGSTTERALVASLASLKEELARSNGEASGMDYQVHRLHAAMERAFATAVLRRPLQPGEPALAGKPAAQRAREVLFAEVLLPYNALLGQSKKPDNTAEFAYRARGIFVRWLYAESGIPRESASDVLWVFTSLLDLVEANRAATRAEWGDSRFVWLPLQYGLLPQDHDTQAELDAIVERATSDQFSDGNYISYILNEQFQYQLSRTIHEAEEYHVLWTHDYRGFDTKYDGSKASDPDEMAFRHTVRSYLAALTARVRAYDSTGTFPVYIILLDEWFYQVRRGRLWLNLLEDPTRHRLRLPSGFEAWEDTIAAAQDSLRAAIASSALLQAQARQYGSGWLRSLVKVHVNITNASDPSFWSWGVIKGLPIPDNMMRDHRKIVFYDLTEEDPSRGAAMYTGAGVGEHYANLSWEDRSIIVNGPAALGLKHAARDLLLSQGMPEEEIPHGLEPRPVPARHDSLVRPAATPGGRAVRAVQLHNETGFGDKNVNVAKAVLYTLMPAGSVIKIPDSMWNCPLWGSAMLGASLRGVRVMIIAPSDSNHPVGNVGPRILARELLLRLLAASRFLDGEIASAGGLLKIGIYNADFDVTNLHAKASAVEATFARHAWLRDLYGFPEETYAALRDLIQNLAAVRRDTLIREFEFDPRPKLHLKANFFASREAWSLLARPGWGDWAWEFVLRRIDQLGSRSTELLHTEQYPSAMLDFGDAEVSDWYSGLAPATRERVVFYTMIGSQNQNNRSLISDGEDALVIAHWPSVISYLDFISLAGQSKWVETPEELASLISGQSRLKTWFTRWFRLAM